MKLTRNSKCPLCGSGMTDFHDSYSDGDECIRASITRNVCTNRNCGLPVKLWEKVAELVECRNDNVGPFKHWQE